MTRAADEPPDFIMCCEKHRTPYVVQTYKWKDDQDTWVPARPKATKITELRNDSNEEFWNHVLDDSKTPDGKIRLHHETTCGATNCRNKLSADTYSIEQAFWMIVTCVKLCAEARSRGTEPNPTAATFAAMPTEITTNTVTMSFEAMRTALHATNSPRNTPQ